LASDADSPAAATGRDKVMDMGPPAERLTHRLMTMVARALTGAITILWRTSSVLALPIHDGLLVRSSSAEETQRHLCDAYEWTAGVRIRCTVCVGAGHAP
jgi:hypothetical protein